MYYTVSRSVHCMCASLLVCLVLPSHALLQVGTGMRQGEGAQFYDRYPAWSLLGQMVADALSAVDVLTVNQGVRTIL